jgi:enoyl-CoA hydratase
MQQAPIVVEREAAITTIALNRPARLNALSYELLRLLEATLRDLRDDATCRVIVLTGTGRGFCAGIDLNQVGESQFLEDSGAVQSKYALQCACSRIVSLLRAVPQPVIAAVNGVAAGGGFSLALAADIRILEPGARFTAAFVRIGASGGDMGSSFFLPRLVGWERAAELLYTARFVEAEEAVEIGLASRLVGEGESPGAARELARAMCAHAPFGTRMTKSLLNQSMDGATLDQTIELENRTQVLLGQTGDFADAVAAFAERREPHYSDR